MAQSKPRFNRRARRLALKADRCLSRKTKIPAGVIKRLDINPGYLNRLAGAHGLEVGVNGIPKPRVAAAGSDSTAAESELEQAA